MSTDPTTPLDPARWDLVASAAGIGSYVLHLPSRRLELDERALVLSGLPPEAASSRLEDAVARTHPGSTERVLAAVERAITSGGPHRAEPRFTMPDGTHRWLAVRGEALVDAAGATTALVGAVHDVTDLRETSIRTSDLLEQMSVGYVALDGGWRLTYVNAEAERILGASRADLLGADMWERFPAAVGSIFETSYRRAVATGEPVTFDAHYPAPLDVWVEVRAAPRSGGLGLYFIDITARRAAEADRDVAARQVADLAEAALSLARAETVEDLVVVVAERGLAALGADGGAVAVPDPADPAALLSYITTSLGEEARGDYARLPLEAPLPVCAAATTQRTVLLEDEAASLAFSPLMASVNASTGCQAWASLPLRAGGQVLGVLTAGWRSPQRFTPGQVALLDAFAAQCAQALQRLRALDAERAANRSSRRFSETLQRSLLTAPPEPEGLQIAVRYSPAAAEAQVGGDWYDAFLTSGGTTSLVIGDVTGHDQHAAAAMGQLRNLLRGVGHALADRPAAVLSALDRSLDDLAVGAMATTVLAAVDQGPAQEPAGSRTLRWSNAGHPPPLLISPDGSTTYLDTEPDLLLGVDPATARADHEVELEPGASVLLFTDGLVERRGAPLQAGLDWLAEAVADLAHLPLEQLCDALLAQVGDRVEDDVALLAVRALPARTTTSTTVLEPHPAAVKGARAFVQRRCEAAGADPDTTDTAVLLASELVTNAFLHGRSQTRLTVVTTPAAVRVEVGDDNSRPPVLAAHDDSALDGRGVAMVDLLAASWGVRPEAQGKTVWFTVDRT